MGVREPIWADGAYCRQGASRGEQLPSQPFPKGRMQQTPEPVQTGAVSLALQWEP